MSIGEVSHAIGITRRIILNYEHMGLVAPDSKDGSNGNRYYSADSLTRIRSIRVLQELGLSLKEIKDYFDDSSNLSAVVARLRALRDKLDLNIEKLTARLNEERKMEIKFETLPKLTAYCRTMRAASIEEKKENLRSIVPQVMKKYGSDTSRRMYFTDYPLSDPDCVTYCIAVPRGSRGEYVSELPDIPVVMITFRGLYEQLPLVREKLVKYCAEHGIATRGNCLHLYLEGPPQHTDPHDFITQIALPINERRRGTRPPNTI